MKFIVDVKGRNKADIKPLGTCKTCKHNAGINTGYYEGDIVCDYYETDGQTVDDFCSRYEEDK